MALLVHLCLWVRWAGVGTKWLQVGVPPGPVGVGPVGVGLCALMSKVRIGSVLSSRRRAVELRSLNDEGLPPGGVFVGLVVVE